MAETCGGGAARAGTARAGATALPREQRLYVLERLRGERKSRRPYGGFLDIMNIQLVNMNIQSGRDLQIAFERAGADKRV